MTAAAKKKDPGTVVNPLPPEQTVDFKLTLLAHHVFGLFTAALKWAVELKEESLSHMQQLKIEFDGTALSLVATNGKGLWWTHAMPFEKAFAETPFETFVSGADARLILRVISQRSAVAVSRRRRRSRSAPVVGPEEISLWRSKEVLGVRVGRFTLDLKPAEHRSFPDWRKLLVKLERQKPAEAVGIDVNLLVRLTKSLPGTRARPEIVCRVGGPLDPILYEGRVGEVPVNVLVMPMRV